MYGKHKAASLDVASEPLMIHFCSIICNQSSKQLLQSGNGDSKVTNGSHFHRSDGGIDRSLAMMVGYVWSEPFLVLSVPTDEIL